MDATPVTTDPHTPQGLGRGDALGFRPLYRQVKDAFIKRMGDGSWPPGFALPSEIQLAAEMGVSQGTVRKALDELTAEHLVTRRQGVGSFVAEHDEQRILFQFFKLKPDDGGEAFPDSQVVDVEAAPATAQELAELALTAGSEVIRIRRVRALAGKPVVAEWIVLPAALYPGLAQQAIPNNLYALYAGAYGVTVGRAREKLKAVSLERADAALLGVPTGCPALAIDRVAYALDGTPAEWRRWVCLTDEMHYLSDLR
jgi:GntR family transcriptional regulator